MLAAVIIAIIAIDIVILNSFLSKLVINPLKKIFEAMKKIGEGNYENARIDIKRKDEVGQLAEAFNDTTNALAKTEEEKNMIDTAKTRFLSITSHELRSPMTPMKAQLQMLEEGYFGDLNEKQKESLHMIIRNAERLDKIISDFLEISRIESARLKFDFEETDLTNTIQETVNFMEGFAKEKKIKLKTDIDDLPTIEVDPDRVNQVLRNLIHNAIKFSGYDSEIKVSAELKDDHILFSVEDHGAGMTPEDQIRVFEPFYQIDKASHRRHGGTGLGLAICRGIVESQNGKIWVESKVGEGSTFYFTVPLEPVKKIKPIKILFSRKSVIDKKIEDEFKTMLGPIGASEFKELKNKNAINKEDLIDYIDTLENQHILKQNKADDFKIKINEIFGEKNRL
ncbi:MAG: HAMP domain-containing sensor histidine kinase [Candidatus Thermoplasmatota archaeon]